jgi:hypothetical protein
MATAPAAPDAELEAAVDAAVAEGMPPAGDVAGDAASAEVLAGGLSDAQRATLAEVAGQSAETVGGETPAAIDPALLDQSQELLEKQAEEKQPEEPVLDRVLWRLSETCRGASAGYCSTSPEVRLSGEMAELNAKLFNAMLAEGVPCRGQGDTLQFLLETLAENLKRAF